MSKQITNTFCIKCGETIAREVTQSHRLTDSQIKI